MVMITREKCPRKRTKVKLDIKRGHIGGYDVVPVYEEEQKETDYSDSGRRPGRTALDGRLGEEHSVEHGIWSMAYGAWHSNVIDRSRIGW